MSNKKYWQNFGDHTESERYQKAVQKEFQEELLPIEELEQESLLASKTPRRDFLKYLGFSTAAAAVAAGCEMPVRKAVPYLVKPEEMIPGVADYFASTYVNNGEAISVLVKQRDGRPIKIEGNPESPLTMGGTSAQAQASVLDLYDPTRLRHPLQRSGADFKEVTSFENLDTMISSEIAGLGNQPIVLLTSTINSPSTLEVINRFLTKYPSAKHVQYDAVSHSGMLQANELSYGKKAIPAYQFDKAKLIVSLGADFLGTWLNSVQYSKAYADNRKVKNSNAPAMNRHIQFESMMSLTGSNADDRFVHKPSETGMVAAAILSKLTGGAASTVANPKLAKGIDMAASELAAAKGQALVVCGSNDVNVQLIVNAINEAVGANGTTINWGGTTNTRKGIDSDMVTLANDIMGGKIGGLFVYGANPVYSYADGEKLGKSIAKLPLSVSFNLLLDQTAENCKYIIPSHHWLESWGDAEPVSGYVSIIQPLINPLFKTRPFETSLLKWSGNAGNMMPVSNDSTTANLAQAPAMQAVMNGDAYETFYKNFWSQKAGDLTAWETMLQRGIVPNVAVNVSGGSYNGGSVAAALTKVAGAKKGDTEVVLYQKISIGSGNQANNPWLQELPDPITKVTWDNYVVMHPVLAKEILKIDVIANQRQADAYEVTPEKPVVKVTVNGKSETLPVLIIPGIQEQTIAIAVGYGQKSSDDKNSLERIGRAATGAGKNAYPLVSFNGVNMLYSAPVTIEKTGDVYPLAQTQVHGFTEGRPVVYETSLKDFIANPKAMLAEATEERELLTPAGYEDYRRDATIYPDYARPGMKWGMSIDLNTCTGCSACVIACTAENNVSVVGKTQVQRAHEMHWLRIDRYFTGDMENPDVMFQPMLCQHCDNAPCENVCPVAATPHSSEGLNQMAYNRCIGTRYCANNCPYKVRRFNWADFTGADSFANNQEPLRGGDLTEAVFQMNDDLTRMVLNPDVTVRSRGVMEKCSFCVQRLQDGKLEAKKQEDPSIVRNVKTACSQACPTNAITFGNVNDKASDVVMARSDANRNFYVLEQLHTLPNVSYLAKLRNTPRTIGAEMEERVERNPAEQGMLEKTEG